MNFTQAQTGAIEVTDRNLIVSAGAGAGKTATLVERVYRVITSGDDPCSVDELLIVTFTRTAAQEMKQRLAARLSADLAEPLPPEKRDRLEEQLFLLPRANISTIHSYCLELISAYPEAAGLPPGFELMAEGEARLYHQEFVARKLEEALAPESPHRPVLQRLLAQLSPVGALDRVQRTVVSLHQFLSSIPEPGQFAEACGRLLDPGDDGPRLALLERQARERLAALRSRIDAAIAGHGKGIQRLGPQYAHYSALPGHIDSALKSDDVLAATLSLMGDLSIPRVSGRKDNQTAEDEAFQRVHERLKGLVNREKPALEALCSPEAPDRLLESRESILALVRDFGSEWVEELDASHIEMRRLTFHHLEKLALQMLDGPDGRDSAIARIQQDRFRYMLIDEFQDVNEFQERILRRVCRVPANEAGGNLFVVGDVKQSIFAFRQADPTLFLDTYNRSLPWSADIPPGADARIDLAENFRSAAPLLEEFNALFAKLLRQATIGLDYTAGQAFVPGRIDDPERPPRCPPGLQLDFLPKEPDWVEPGEEEEEKDSGAPKDEAREALVPEAEHVARLVESIGPPWKDVAILLRSARNTAPAVVEALERRAIPVYTDSRTGYLTAVEVMELQYLLRAIHNPFEDIALLAMLRGPAGRWSEDELLRLRFVNRRSPFFDNLRAAAGDADCPLRESAAAMLENLRRWQDMSIRHTTAEFLSLLMDELHLIERASVRPGGDQRKRNLQQMVQHAEEFDGFQRKGLGEFLRYLDDLLENGDDFAPPVPLPEDAEVVRIMTVHKSKGMQFPIVVAPFLGMQFNDLDARGDAIWDRRLGMATKFRDSGQIEKDNPLLFDMLARESRKHARSEELRLLYVAMTRAKEAVYLCGSARQPERTLEGALEMAESGFPPQEILAAQSSLTWVLPHFLERLGLAGPDIVPGEWTDGPVRFRYLRQPMEESEAPPATDGREPPADWQQQYGEALTRIRRLLDAPERPSIRAKLSVSEAKRAFDAARDGETPPYPRPAAAGNGEHRWRPANLAPETTPGGALAGTATHRFLANCDLGALSAGRVRLHEELERLQRENLLSAEEAPLVLVEEIARFLNGPLGRRLRLSITEAWRELPFTVRIDAGEFTAEAPGDFVVLQGVADLLFREGDGWVLVDYKTDWCGDAGERVEALVRSYTPQLQLYRLAVERTLREPVKETWLVFLRAGSELPIPARGAEAFPWEDIVEAGAVVGGVREEPDGV